MRNSHLRRGSLLIFSVIGVLVVLVACGACSSSASNTAPVTPPSVGEDAGGLSETAFGSSPCAICKREQCANDVAECLREPTCGRYLSCVDRCERNEATGDVDPACATKCPPPEGTAATEARDHFTTCAASKSPQPCSACKNDDPTKPLAILEQKCAKAPNESDKCDRCLAERCCDTASACDDDPACGRFRRCFTDCRDEMCRRACYDAAGRETVTRFGRDAACFFVACFDKSACDQAEGNQNLEDICRYTECASDFIACYSEPDCIMFQSCSLSCGISNEPCLLECHARFPKGKALFDNSIACTTIRCDDKR